MEMGEEVGGCLTSGNAVLKWKESLPMLAETGGQLPRTSLMGQWRTGGACWCEANLTRWLLLRSLEVLLGPETRRSPWKARGRCRAHSLGKGRKGSPHEPWLCGASGKEVFGRAAARLCCQGMMVPAHS